MLWKIISYSFKSFLEVGERRNLQRVTGSQQKSPNYGWLMINEDKMYKKKRGNLSFRGLVIMMNGSVDIKEPPLQWAGSFSQHRS